MTRKKRFLTAAILVTLLLLGISIYLRSWGGVVLLLVGAGALAWYRVQVARGEAAEQFFGDAGEDTRLTAFQGGSPSEMPVDRALRGRDPDDSGH